MKTLFVDEQIECLENLDNTCLLSDINSLYKDCKNILELTEPPEYTTKSVIYNNISDSARYLAYFLSSNNRSVYVIPKDDDCKTEMQRLSLENTYSVVIDGKLYVREEDGEPQC